jgi:hypothetical protein
MMELQVCSPICFASFCCHLWFGISLVWFSWSCSFCYVLLCEIQEYKIHLCGPESCWTALLMHKMAVAPTFVGSSNHDPFAAILSYACQGHCALEHQAIRDSEFTKPGPEKSSGERNIDLWNGVSGNGLTSTGKCCTVQLCCLYCGHSYMPFSLCSEHADPFI